MRSDDKFTLIMIFVMCVTFAWWYTTMAYTHWRPLVSQWAEISVPHQARPIEVPRRIIWNGVEYECTLIGMEID